MKHEKNRAGFLALSGQPLRFRIKGKYLWTHQLKTNLFMRAAARKLHRNHNYDKLFGNSQIIRWGSHFWADFSHFLQARLECYYKNIPCRKNLKIFFFWPFFDPFSLFFRQNLRLFFVILKLRTEQFFFSKSSPRIFFVSCFCTQILFRFPYLLILRFHREFLVTLDR